MSTPCLVAIFAKQYEPTGISIRVENEGKPEQIGQILRNFTDEDEIIQVVFYGGDARIFSSTQKYSVGKTNYLRHETFEQFLQYASDENVDYFYVFRDGAWENWKFYEIDEPKLLEYKNEKEVQNQN